MKHIDFSRPLRLINLDKRGNLHKNTFHERNLIVKKVTWPRDPKKFHDSPTRRKLQK